MSSIPNSFVTQVGRGTTPLTYALELSPTPLTVSLTNEPVIGTLQFVVTNPSAAAVAVTSVGFTIQVGTASSNLTATTAPIDTDVSDTTNWEVVGPPASVMTGSVVYTLQPATGSSVTLQPGESVLVQIYGFQTGDSPGNTTINVKEMVVGYVWPLSNSWPNLGRGIIFGSNSDGINVPATGGTYGLYNSDWGMWDGGLNNSFIMSVRKGGSWSVSVFQAGNNEIPASVAFYWIPMGTAQGATFERTGDATPPKVHAVRRVPVDKRQQIPKLLDEFDHLLPHRMPTGNRARITVILEKMNTNEYTVEEFWHVTSSQCSERAED